MTIATLNDQRSAARIASLHMLIAELRQRTMTRGDIQGLLNMTQSGVRGYINDVLPVLEVTRARPNEQFTYRLTDDAEQVARFLANLGEVTEYRKAQNVTRSPKKIAERDPARHVHLLADDAPFKVRLHRGPVMRDPMALPVGFFRSEVRA
jgi:hypothetical protein